VRNESATKQPRAAASRRAAAADAAARLVEDHLQGTRDEEDVKEAAARAGEGRVAAMELADEQAGTNRRVGVQHTWHAGKRFTALQAMLRGVGGDARPVYPGDEVSFEADEGIHVRDLVDQEVIAIGPPSAKVVQDRLAKADLARADAVRRSNL
jgi:hypothetical protein